MIHFQRFRRLSLPLLLASLTAVLAACSPQTTFDPRSDAADRVHTIYILVTVAASVIGAAVLAAMAFILIRFRAKPGRQAQQIHGSTKLEIAWTIAPILVLIMIGVPTVIWIAGTSKAAAEDALHIRVVAHQWWWEFEYEGLGPNGGPLVTSNELHIPLGREVAITLESVDVIHSFWVPQLVGKTDAIPNRVNRLESFKANEIGEYYGQCAEFCGSAHALMRFRVYVDSLADFEQWVAGMQTPPAEPASALAKHGESVFFGAGGCSACHAIYGTNASGKVGPDLTLLGERHTIAAGVIPNTDENLRKWIHDVRSIKPLPEGSSMPTFAGKLSDADIAGLAAYLKGQQLQ